MSFQQVSASTAQVTKVNQVVHLRHISVWASLPALPDGMAIPAANQRSTLGIAGKLFADLQMLHPRNA
eukprot:3265089-Alexandrium_andersonii.AAC.1